MKSGLVGNKKTVRKTVKNLIIKQLNIQAILSRVMVKVHSVFFDIEKDIMYLYTTTHQGKLNIACKYEKGIFICTPLNDSTISLAIKAWLDRALGQTVQHGKILEKEQDANKKRLGALATINNTVSWLSTLEAFPAQS